MSDGDRLQMELNSQLVEISKFELQLEKISMYTYGYRWTT